MTESPLKVGQKVLYRRLFETKYRNSEVVENLGGMRDEQMVRLASGDWARADVLIPIQPTA